MSKFCGKCDFFDHVDSCNEERLKNMKVYVNNTLVKTDTEKDRALYYPFLISIGGFGGGNEVIYLTSRSHISIKEEDCIEFFFRKMATAYRRCKRKNTPFTYENATKKIAFLCNDGRFEEPLHEIYERVSKSRKVNIDGIHIKDGITAYYRNEWLKELIRVGWQYDEAKKWIDEH